MSKDYITLHPKLGLNARLTVCQCPICLKEHDGKELVLLGNKNRVDTCAGCGTNIYGGLSSSHPCPKCQGTYASKTRELGEFEKLPGGLVICNQCEEWMKQGIILFSVADDNRDMHTGRLCVVKEEAVKRMISDKVMLKSILQKRATAVSDEAWSRLGLPT